MWFFFAATFAVVAVAKVDLEHLHKEIDGSGIITQWPNGDWRLAEWMHCRWVDFVQIRIWLWIELILSTK